MRQLFYLFFLLFCNQLFAQKDDHSMFIENDKIDTLNKNKLLLTIRNINFFKNQEYFNNIIKGYTLIGFNIRPTLAYYPTKNTKVEAGMHLLKYGGLNSFSTTTPFFRFQYSPTNTISFILGNIYGGANHRLIEPFYKFERNFGIDYIKHNNNTLESGLQCLIDYTRFKSDVWLDWQKFIYRNDTFKEELNGGVSTRTYITNPKQKLTLSAPVQFYSIHKGGQGTKTNDTLSTLLNMSAGLIADKRFDSSFVKSIGIKINGAAYHISSGGDYFRLDGKAVYSTLYLLTKYINISVSYWHADKFIAPLGEELYQSQSTENTTLFVTPRQLVIPKLFIHHHISNGIDIGCGYEAYADLKRPFFDYYYSVFLTFNSEFFLKQIKTNF